MLYHGKLYRNHFKSEQCSGQKKAFLRKGAEKMAVVSMFYAALDETPNTIAFPGLCKRVRFRRSSCRRCVEICPENAISLEPGPLINSGCSDCGLCERVCPTEAFGNPVCTDLDLLSRASSLPEKGKLVIRCERAESESKYAFPVPCLGRVSENVILGVVLLGFKEVRFIRGMCFACPKKSGEELFLNSIMAARALMESLGMENSRLNFMESAGEEEKALSRQEILSRISGEVKRNASSCIAPKGKEVARTTETGKGQTLSLKRRVLRTLINLRGLKSSTILRSRPEFPWGKIRIDEKTCTACGSCRVLCPTGAISTKSENDCQVLYFNTSLCTNCSLCREACPKHAIDFEVNFPLPDIFEDEAKVVAKVKSIPCVVCGEMITAKKGNLCFTRQKRQVRPTYASPGYSRETPETRNGLRTPNVRNEQVAKNWL